MNTIRHTGIVTNNLKKSLWFWREQLKFKIKKTANERGDTIDSVLGYKNVKVRTIKLADNRENLIEILYFLNPPKVKKNKVFPYSNGITHLSITVKKLNNLYKKLKKNKVKFFSPPLKSPYDPVSTCFCYDPDNYLIQFVEGAQVKSRK